METIEEIVGELRKIPWFQELRDDHVRKIASISKICNVQAGDVLFREGDKQHSVYVVLEGRVGLEMFVPHRGKVRFYTAEKWEIFGWSSFTPNIRQRTASAVAVMEGSILCTDADALYRACDEDHDLGYRVMRRLATVVAGRLLVTRLQLLDMFANPEMRYV